MAALPKIKICGITTMEAMETALSCDADYIGLVFWPGSVRNLSVEAGAFLSARAKGRAQRVGLFVDADDAWIDAITRRVGLDMIQLHGHEDAKRVQAVRDRAHLPVSQALRLSVPIDLQQPSIRDPVADMLVFDANVPGQLGGTGVAFDWAMLKNFGCAVPWMLSGGLNAQNIRAALDIVTPDAVDVSSGVEISPGVKAPEKIRAFIDAVRQS